LPTRTTTPTWETGTTVGRYVLLAPLAEGGMAEIWLARQSGLQGFEKLVVIKRMANATEAEPEFIEMFLTEARLAAQLSHPHIVQIFDLGEEAGAFYMAMEYLDGEDLARIRRAGNQLGKPLPDALVAFLIAQAAAGLHYAHTRAGLDGKPLAIVHRDVSPQNLIVTWDGSLKIVDFGIAKAATQSTVSGKLKGKLGYMAPEQARLEPVDARSDVFALGVVLFELLTHTRLLPKLGDADILATIAGDVQLPRPSERRPGVPYDLERIVLRAMSRDPAERYQSAREMQEALEGYLREHGHVVSAGTVSDYLRGVFAERIAERKALIEAALRADLTPASAKNMRLLGEGSVSRSLVGPARSLKLAVAVGALVTAAIIGLVAWKVTRPAPPPPVPVVVVKPEPPPPAVPPSLAVDTVPRGAAVEVNGEPRGVAPLKLELPVGAHRVRASLAGHVTAEREVVFTRDGERVEVVLSLTPTPVAPPPVEPTATDGSDPVDLKAKKAAMGRLTLKTEPWTTVYLKKRKLGDTPLLAVPLPAGTHTLRLVNPDSSIEKTVQVEIAPNKTTVKKLQL
jgi:serine/threonine-protein kinase